MSFPNPFEEKNCSELIPFNSSGRTQHCLPRKNEVLPGFIKQVVILRLLGGLGHETTSFWLSSCTRQMWEKLLKMGEIDHIWGSILQ
jgi:hypothetical protein